MGYFEDIQFVSGAVIESCVSSIDQRFRGTWSIEFMRSGRLFMGMDHGEQEIVEDPVIFWHSPEHSYQYGPVDSKGWHHHYVLMRGPRAARLIDDGFSPLSPRGYLRVRRLETIESLFLRLVDLVESSDPRRHPDRVILVEQILAVALHEARSPTPTHHRHADLDAVAQTVSSEPLGRHDFRMMARDMGLSYHRFRHVFREQIGQAPNEFAMNCRIRRAAELLRDVSMQVQEIGRLCGYDDPGLFTRTFKKRMGLTPRQYRQTHVALQS